MRPGGRHRLRPSPTSVGFPWPTPACGVVVHHGGQGTSLIAMVAGRPQFVLAGARRPVRQRPGPGGGRRGRRPAHVGATPEAVAKGCLHLLEDDRYAEAASRLAAVTSRMPAPSALVAPLEALALSGAGR
ncbi:nucleotide disphospho-sugar-binding domain-containing protein [Streptomyces griseofuscus]|uniref:nucleotide disphospho-sugar-binding domain-containing protein n=1 Tax=Streptomyces griseofuscus TaxID=146922 RepID=UPI00381BA9BB